MRPSERHRTLLALLDKQEELSVEDCCELLRISPATARRDFVLLHERGQVQKTWGGIRRTENATPAQDMIPVPVRDALHSDEKARIALAAAQTVRDGDVILIDGGTTTLRMIPHLANRPVRILTNSILIAHRVDALRSRTQGAEVHVTGGFLYPGSGLLVGPDTVRAIRNIHARIAFLSVGGLDAEGGSNTNQLVVESERAMIDVADAVCVLADHWKWDRKEMVRAFTWDEINHLYTDAPPPAHINPTVLPAITV